MSMTKAEALKAWKDAHPEKVKAYGRRSYLARKAAKPDELRRFVRESAARYRAWLASLKIGGNCSDCGLSCTQENYAAFDWDHRPGEVKLFALSRAPRDREKVLAEVAKCDLRCKNCHAVITHQREIWRVAGV